MNPVIRREFVGILRSPRAFGMLACLTLVFSIAVLMRWPSDASVDLSGLQSLQVFRVFGYGLMTGVIFLVPAFPATSLVNEKNSGTLALLLNSPMNGASIYLGKISGVLLFSLLVLLCSLPASAACYAMGGIGGDKFFLLYLVLGLLAFQYSTLGMLISSYVQSSDSAVRLTYAAVFGLLFVSLLPDAFFRGTGVGGDFAAGIGDWIRNLSPLPAIMEIMGQGSVGSFGLKTLPGFTRFILLVCLSSAGLASWTIARLNHRIFDQSRSKGVITDDRSSMSRVFRRLVYIVDPQRRKGGIPWYLNPVMVKEYRSRRFGRAQWLLRLVSVCAVTSMVLTYMAATGITSWGVETIGALLVLLQVVLVIVLAPSLGSGLISGERDSGGWELLRMTPISSFRLVFGKLMSVVWTLLLVLMATLPGYVMMVLIAPELTLQVQQVLVCLLWTSIYALAISAAVGSLFRSTAVSTSITYVAVISIFLLPLLVWLGRDAPFGFETVQTALMTTPVGAALSVIEAPGFESYELLPASWWIAGVLSSLMFLVLGVQVWRLTRAV
jgi:ABC-type transport system involved in multi-copper enzyme maturation permease subunit